MLLSIDLSLKYGVLEIIGTKAQDFLQGQLTADLKTSKTGISAYCDAKGKTLAIVRYYQFEANSVLLIMPSCIIATIKSELEFYGKFSKIIINNISDKYHIIGTINQQPEIHIISKNHINTNNYLNNPINNTIIDYSTWLMHNINFYIPEVFVATQGLFLPHHINLHNLNAINFKKGCFRGQEIIARMQYRGSIIKELAILQIKDNMSIISPGYNIFNDLNTSTNTPCGTILYSTTYGDTIIALAEIKKKDLASNLFIKDNNVLKQIYIQPTIT